MSLSPTLPTLDFYTRDGCQLCDEARTDLQAVLEDRVRRGDPIARVREVHLSDQPEFESRYGALIPVLALGGQELTLVMSQRAIDRFLDRVLGRLA
jgi:hypothetical protein